MSFKVNNNHVTIVYTKKNIVALQNRNILLVLSKNSLTFIIKNAFINVKNLMGFKIRKEIFFKTDFILQIFVKIIYLCTS
ncbi:hypothetical protein EHP00_2150 [Ecytonucleospora hepatopenaei]|uniref:Uncharacterized protein n=1 Tax=Ecytonucleospora hepatopenaei TaxID=646526 RepID=A0A1W0E603_9MICR|nr:hypothetical protein EHP00_2150 [Ecytonucleospora hepatopenaei]